MNLTRRQWIWLASVFGTTQLVRGQEAFAQEPLFAEVPPSASGITWVHENAISPSHYLPEALGPGCAFLDFDNDGWMDIFLVNSGPSDFWKPTKPVRNALYKNNRDGTFTDVTEKAGVSGAYFGMGVAVGDYDNDGWPDLFVTAYGKCILYKNNHDGTFSDVTEKARLATPGWTTSAVWFDYDADGKLDLFVCSFVDYSGVKKLECGNNQLGKNYYCVPRVFKPTTSFLYHNNGDGTFTEVSKGTAIARAMGKGLGVVATDINNDGRTDFFVANDTVQNFLFVSRGPGANGRWNWEEIALQAGVGFSESGRPRSGMGVDAADLNGNGWQDLFVANVDHEMFSVYENNKDETFRDVAHANGVARSTRLLSGWGLKYFDYDNDGAIDLFLANGHPDDMIDNYSMQVKYKEPLLLFHQGEDRKLHDVSDQGGPAFQKYFAARGLAVGDFDNDGALDVLIGNNGAAPLLLKNNAAKGNNWLGLKLEGAQCNRDAIGAKIYWTAGGKKRFRLKNNGGSYLSSHDPREVLGIGTASKIDELEIHWPAPSKQIDRLTNLPLNQYVRVVENGGIREYQHAAASQHTSKAS
ncbi:MAG: CRTAC1 family protein [Acidobacteria bacterium]|nr:MAG: CRTAC1 family protein [Acidobacteriota bacterium]